MTVTLPPTPEWMDEGLCAQVDPVPFFPEGQGASAYTGKKICNTAPCPVRDLCREYGIVNADISAGVWGGLSFPQIRKERTRRGIGIEYVPTHGTTAGYAAHRRAGERACEDCLAAEARRTHGRKRTGTRQRKERAA
jgi:hypothetical protein